MCQITGRLAVFGYWVFYCLVLASNRVNPKGRRNCDFSANPGPNSCLDGGCNGGLECDKKTGTVRKLFDLLAAP
jgi:hypothetical protein